MKSTEAQRIKNMGVKPKLLTKQLWLRVTPRTENIVINIARDEGKYRSTVARDLLVDGLKYRGIK